jgi:hypothetical protein
MHCNLGECSIVSDTVFISLCNFCFRFDVCTAVNIKIVVFWDVIPCSGGRSVGTCT